MKLLDEYFALQKQIHDYFGYQEDWKVIPLDDATKYFWCLDENEVQYAETEQELVEQSGKFYSNEIYRQRFLPKWVYRTQDYTMVCVDTNCDGNKFMQVFDNSLERQ